MYCSVDDMLTVASNKDLIVLTNSSQPTAQSINTVFLNRIISEKSEVIDGYIGSKYPLPLLTVPPILRTICKELVYCELYRFGNYADINKSQVIEARDLKAMKMLADIRDGKTVLSFEGTITAENETVLPRVTIREPVFTTQLLKGF